MIKQIILVVLAVLGASLIATAQTQTGIIFTYNGDSIVRKSAYINPLDSNPDKGPTYTVDSSTVTVDKNNYTVKLQNYNLARDDAGYYRIINILYNGQNILNLAQFDGWDKIPSYLQTYKTTDFYFEMPLSDEATALIFVGWPYNSEPEQMTIVVLYKGKATMVLNKQYAITAVTKNGSDLSFDIQSEIQEWVNDDQPYNNPATLRIWAEDGILKLRKL